MHQVKNLPISIQNNPHETLDVWCFSYETVCDSALLNSYEALMTEDERARFNKFKFERDRLLFLATRALVRTVLSNYIDVPPSDWRFVYDKYGKPHVSTPATSESIFFSLTNTPGLVICAVSHVYDQIGVDAEWLERPGDIAALADHYFSPLEVQALRALPSAQQRDRFFRYWTLKESYLKARGLGLSLPLNQFSFLLDDGSEIHVVFESRLTDSPTQWSFVQFTIGSSYIVALGVKTGGTSLTVRMINYVPLLGIIPFEIKLPSTSPP